jgi:hypothetical protein
MKFILLWQAVAVIRAGGGGGGGGILSYLVNFSSKFL